MANFTDSFDYTDTLGEPLDPAHWNFPHTDLYVRGTTAPEYTLRSQGRTSPELEINAHCRLNQVVSGSIEIIWNYTEPATWFGGSYSAFYHFIRIKAYDTSPFIPPEESGYPNSADSGYSNHMDIGHNSFDLCTRVNTSYYNSFVQEGTMDVSDATSFYVKVVIDTSTGDIDVYANINGGGYQLLRTESDFFPDGSKLEIWFANQRADYSYEGTWSWCYYDEISITATTFEVVPIDMQGSLKELTANITSGYIESLPAYWHEPFLGSLVPTLWWTNDAYNTLNICDITVAFPISELGFEFYDYYTGGDTQKQAQFPIITGNFIISCIMNWYGGANPYVYTGLEFEIGDDTFSAIFSKTGSDWQVYISDDGGFTPISSEYNPTPFDSNPKVMAWEIMFIDTTLTFSIKEVTEGSSDTWHVIYQDTNYIPSEEVTQLSLIANNIHSNYPDVEVAYTDLYGYAEGLAYNNYGALDVATEELTAYLIGLLTPPAYTDIKMFFRLTGITGGTSNDLDGINPLDIEGTGYQLVAGSVALVVEDTDDITMYLCKEEAGASSDPPDIIIPVTNPGNFYWEKIFCSHFLPAKIFTYDGLAAGTYKDFDYEYAKSQFFWMYFDPTHNNAAIQAGIPYVTPQGMTLYSGSGTGRWTFLAIPQIINKTSIK